MSGHMVKGADEKELVAPPTDAISAGVTHKPTVQEAAPADDAVDLPASSPPEAERDNQEAIPDGDRDLHKEELSHPADTDDADEHPAHDDVTHLLKPAVEEIEEHKKSGYQDDSEDESEEDDEKEELHVESHLQIRADGHIALSGDSMTGRLITDLSYQALGVIESPKPSSTTLRRMEEEDERERKNEEKRKLIRRFALINKCTVAQAEGVKLRKKDDVLQNALRTYFNRTVIFKEPNSEPDSNDKQLAYKDLRGEMHHKFQTEAIYNSENNQTAQETVNRCTQQTKAADKFYAKLITVKKQAILGITHNPYQHARRHEFAKFFIETDSKLSQEMSAVKFQFAKTTKRVRRLKKAINVWEHIGEGLERADYAQMKMINEMKNEQVQDIVESCSMIQRKLTTYVNSVSHMKEKEAHVCMEINQLNGVFDIVDRELERTHKQHNHVRTSRDTLRRENRDLKLEGSMLCHPNLLLDLEYKMDAEEYTRKKLHQLKQTYADCKLTTAENCKNIEKFRAKIAEQSA